MSLVGMLPLIVLIIFVAIPVIIIAIIYKAYKKYVTRITEQLNIEKQQTFNMQKKINELNERINVIEVMLKEID